MVLPGFNVSVHINAIVGSVRHLTFRRVFRTPIGDWAAELELDGKGQVEIFDHHPTIATMRALKAGGTYIADDIIAQGADGIDVHRRAGGATGDQ